MNMNGSEGRMSVPKLEDIVRSFKRRRLVFDLLNLAKSKNHNWGFYMNKTRGYN